MMRKTAAVLSCLFPLTVLQLVAAMFHPIAAIACAVGIGCLSLVLVRYFRQEFEQWWSSVGLVTIASLFGVLTRYFGNPQTVSWVLWLAPVVACSTAEVLILGKGSRSRRCALCRKRTSAGGSFKCPRCSLRVCEDCWNFQSYRCRLCEQNKVPIFGSEAVWWNKQFDLPVPSGRCRLCLAPAAETELRACGGCGRLQCRGCWDYTNGRCAHCNWIVADLPPQLRQLHAAMSPGGRNAIGVGERGIGR